MNWIVYTYEAGATPPCHAYGSFDQSADDQAGVPFTQEVAQQLADSINSGTSMSGVTAMALPLEKTLQPGV